jgi:Na+-transporting methylmalonyl-CoA/oxaloacetate decarboxylase gamma subunit
MHGMGGAFVVMLLLVIFFMPESAFVRHDVINIDTTSHTVEIENPEKDEKSMRLEGRPTSAAAASEPKQSYISELMPWNGYWDKVSFWRTFIRPFFLILSPIVMWATLLFTICISWLVLISITLSQIFSAPPYNFSVASVGATNVSSFVASVLATLVAGYVVDGVATLMSKRNNGIFGKIT